MKRVIIIAAAVSLGLVGLSVSSTADVPTTQPTTQPVGRFQIATGTTAASTPNSQTSATNTILLDTATGDTWMLWSNGNTYYWYKMDRSDSRQQPVRTPRAPAGRSKSDPGDL